jgi:pimeloyl-ACP methyl ester carboxylesterase
MQRISIVGGRQNTRKGYWCDVLALFGALLDHLADSVVVVDNAGHGISIAASNDLSDENGGIGASLEDDVYQFRQTNGGVARVDVTIPG